MTNMFEDYNDPTDPIEAVKTKYGNDPEQAWKALAHSQQHIKTLESERSQSKTLEEVLAEFKNQSVANPPQSPQQPTSVAPAQSVLDDTTLEQKLEKMLKEKAEKERMEAARREVEARLLATYESADKAKVQLQAKAAELGMTVEALNTIALNSPQAFYKLFGLEESQRPLNTAPTMGNIRTNINETKPVDVNAKYRDVLTKDRSKYMSQEVQNAIMAEAMRAAGIKR